MKRYKRIQIEEREGIIKGVVGVFIERIKKWKKLEKRMKI